jgi:hypothetical protein
MPKFLLLFLLISLSAFSQKTITGVVSDSLNQPLESANLIAKPLQEKAGINLDKQKAKLIIDKNRKIIYSKLKFINQILVLCATNAYWLLIFP